MVYGVIRNVQAALKYRGGWKGLLEHMYTVSYIIILFNKIIIGVEYYLMCFSYAVVVRWRRIGVSFIIVIIFVHYICK